jgi:hypothetical protein
MCSGLGLGSGASDLSDMSKEASSLVVGDQHEDRLQKIIIKDRADEQQDMGSKKNWGKLRNIVKENQPSVPKTNTMPPSDSKKPPIKLTVSMYTTE